MLKQFLFFTAFFFFIAGINAQSSEPSSPHVFTGGTATVAKKSLYFYTSIANTRKLLLPACAIRVGTPAGEEIKNLLVPCLVISNKFFFILSFNI